MSGRLNSKHNFLNLWDEYLESGVDNATFVVSVQIGRLGIDLGIAIHPSSMPSGWAGSSLGIAGGCRQC